MLYIVSSINLLNFVTLALQKVGSFGAPMPHRGLGQSKFYFSHVSQPEFYQPKNFDGCMSKIKLGEGPPKGVQPPKFYFYQTSHDALCVSVNFGRDISKIFVRVWGPHVHMGTLPPPFSYFFKLRCPLHACQISMRYI